MPDSAPETLCPLCGGAASATPAKGLSKESPEFLIRRCSGCGHGWTDPPVQAGELGRWYPPAYYGKENVRFNWLFEAMVRVFHRRRARLIARQSSPGPVMDVGCGRGLVAGALKGMGYEAHGVELSEEAAWHARQRMGVQVHIGDFLKTRLPSGHFEVVIFWHSLEHLPDPEAALRHAWTLLKPRGLLVVAVPNSDSLQARIFGTDWFHLDVPRHYFHFGLGSLKLLLQKTGFRPRSVNHFSFEQNPYGWLQSAYNALGLEFNFLYSILKNKSARLVPIRKHPLQALATALLLPALLPAALLLTVLEALLRRGGTVEVYCVKA